MPSLLWGDEFTYEGPPDPEKWSFQTGGHGWGNRELQYHTGRTDPETANAWVSGGRLAIRLRREDFGDCRYTSARLNSRFSWQYGRLEVSAKLPSGAGTWPAVWMLGSGIRESGWPACGEIDVMEHVGRRQDDILFSLHSKRYNHVIGTHLTEARRFGGVSDSFHLYGVDWKEDEIAFLFDGETAVIWRNGDGGRERDVSGWPFNAPFFLLLNLAFGGGLGGEPDEGCLPQSMEIESVRIYR
ncbi:MAG: glycoside hydrolase family 16 protein [Oscillospiraceae bacterium]|jgi:beta-glucanase (GH16 family)|nr:glycoside hydrolase family 16 protein [Oscillospiraceae bacterium]